MSPDILHTCPGDIPQKRPKSEILNGIDDHSRFLVASDARVMFKAADVVASFHQAAA